MAVGTSDGQYYADEAEHLASTNSTMPLGSTEKPAGAFKSDLGSRVPVWKENPEIPDIGEPMIPSGGEFSPGLPSVNQFAENWGKQGPHPEGATLFNTKAGPITEGDISRGIDVGMSFSGGGLGTFFQKVEPMAVRSIAEKYVSDTHSVIKPTVGDNWYIFDKATGKQSVVSEQFAKNFMVAQDTANTQKAFNDPAKFGVKTPETYEQIPFGWSMNEWKQLTPQAKTEISAKGHGWDLNDPVEQSMLEIEKILYGVTPEIKSAAKKVPITESGKNDAYINMFMNAPEPKKQTAKQAFLEGVKQAREDFKASMQELANNLKNTLQGPLTEPKAPKKAHQKAEEAGYTQPAYRGMTIHPETGGAANPVFNFHKAPEMYSSDSPLLADMYSSYLSHHPGIKVPEGTFSEGAQVLPLYIDTRRYHVYDAKGQSWQKANSIAMDEARKAKKPGVIVKNVWDEPNSTSALGKPKNVFITFPSGAGTVKSRFAEKFDPADPNILHAIPTIGIGTAATGYVASQTPWSDE